MGVYPMGVYFSNFNPYTAKHDYIGNEKYTHASNFHQLDVVGRGSQTQLQVGKGYSFNVTF